MNESIIKLHNLMRALTLHAGIKQEVYDSITLELEQFTDGDKKGLYAWLLGIKDKEYKQYKYAKELLPDEMWERYELLQMRGLREQNILKDARVALKTVWKRPFRSLEQRQRVLSKKNPIKHKEIK